MKVILAGLSKTGTKTMNAALTELGYKVYDFPEHFCYAAKVWSKLLTYNGSLDELKEAYKDADAICDLPACYFWDDFLKVFPEAKVILTRRENEDVWWRSLEGHMKAHNSNWMLYLCYLLTWTGFKLAKFQMLLAPAVYGHRSAHFVLEPHWLDERRAKQTYLRHNAYVLQCAPKDRFLDYNVKEGWVPLCKFLGKPVPNIPFPHKNIRSTSTKDMMKEHQLFKKIKKELIFSLSLLMCLIALFIYIALAHFFYYN